MSCVGSLTKDWKMVWSLLLAGVNLEILVMEGKQRRSKTRTKEKEDPRIVGYSRASGKPIVASSDTTPQGGKKPSKLTPEVQKIICDALRAGNYQEVVVDYVGITKATFHNWITRGREEADRIAAGMDPDPVEEKYLNFMVEVKKAKAYAEVQAVAVISKAGNEGTWQAKAWYLERSRAGRWGRKERLALGGDPDGPPLLPSSGEDGKLSDKERVASLKAALRRAEKRAKEEEEA